MTIRRAPRGSRAGGLALAFIALAPAVSAQTAPPAAPARPVAGADGAQAGAAPVVRFDPTGITADEAVRLTLQYQPAIKRQETALALQEGVLEEQSGLFDTALNGSGSFNYTRQDLPQSQQLLIGASSSAARDGTLSLRLTRPFRSGLSLSPFADLTYDRTDYGGFLVPNTLFASTPSIYATRAGLSLAVPLGRGLGARAAAANERAASLDRDAERLMLQHEVSQSALGTVAAYWDLRAAEETAAITEQLAATQAKLTELSKAMIDAGELPRVEIARAQAAEARARAQLNDARRGVLQARVALATAIGVGASGDDATLPHARDAFPPVPDERLLADPDLQPLVDRAAAERRDLAASALRERAGATLEQGAQLNLRARVDLTASGYLAARGEGGAFRGWSSPSTEIALQAERPLGNNVLRGQLVQRQAELNQSRIASTDLRRQIGLNVLAAAGSLRETADRVRRAEEAVTFARSTVDAEVERFRVGESTLIDTVTTRQQQTDAELALVAARHDLAQQIAQLRFETGLLLQDGTVAAPNLVTVPPRTGRHP